MAGLSISAATLALGPLSAQAATWVPVQGNVRLANGTPVCAMVLANGQYMFSCDGTGAFNLNVPLDEQGQVTLFAFADGFAPYSVTAAPARLPAVVQTRTADPDSPLINMTRSVACSGTNRVRVQGAVNSSDGTPLCAMVLANGQHMFTCGGSLGYYDLKVPLDQNDEVTIFGFADGFQPYRQIFNGVICDEVSYVPLNDTGVTSCADLFSSSRTCPINRFPGQDAEHGRDVTHADDSDGHAGFSFTKLDAGGNDLPAGATQWSCVRDNTTGLIWEIKTDDGGLQDVYNTYSWYEPNALVNGGDPGSENWGDCSDIGACDTQAYVQAVNARRVCGASDWRVPSRLELQSIINGDQESGARVDRAYFPRTSNRSYWTSTPYAGDPARAWYVDFNSGAADVTNISKDADLALRLVRSGP